MPAYIQFKTYQAWGSSEGPPDTLRVRIAVRETEGSDKVGHWAGELGRVVVPTNGSVLTRPLEGTQRFQFVDGASVALMDANGQAIDAWKWAPEEAPNGPEVYPGSNGAWKSCVKFYRNGRNYKLWYVVTPDGSGLEDSDDNDEAPAAAGTEEDASKSIVLGILGDDAAGTRLVADSSDFVTLRATPIEIHGIQLFYLNEDAARRDDDDLFPFDDQRVRLIAALLAKPEGEAGEPQYYIDPDPATPITYNNRYFNVGRSRADWDPPSGRYLKMRNDRAPDIAYWRDQHLPNDIAFHRWPGDWPVPPFVWDRLVHKSSTYYTTSAGTPARYPNPAGDDGRPRDYWYEREDLMVNPPSGGTRVRASGWSCIDRFPPGMHRFRVSIDSGAGAPTRPSTISSCNATDLVNGTLITLCVRKRNVAAAAEIRDTRPELRSMLQWATMFLGVPYEWGGVWFGGRTGPRNVAGHGGATSYDGYGIDCSGLLGAAAYLAGMRFADWGQGSGQWPAGTTDLAANDIKPGDVMWHGGHIRLVYDVTTTGTFSTADPGIRCIESSSSGDGVVFFPHGGGYEKHSSRGDFHYRKMKRPPT